MIVALFDSLSQWLAVFYNTWCIEKVALKCSVEKVHLCFGTSQGLAIIPVCLVLLTHQDDIFYFFPVFHSMMTPIIMHL